MSFGEIRKEVKELRGEFADFRRKLRVARRGGFTPEEKKMLKEELSEVVKEAGDVLEATVETIKEVTDFLEKRL